MHSRMHSLRPKEQGLEKRVPGARGRVVESELRVGGVACFQLESESVNIVKFKKKIVFSFVELVKFVEHVLLGCLSFHQPPGLCLLYLSLFSSSSVLRPSLIHALMTDLSRAFVHGHTFLHSWSGPMTLVDGLLHGATFLSNLPLVLFVFFIGP